MYSRMFKQCFNFFIKHKKVLTLFENIYIGLVQNINLIKFYFVQFSLKNYRAQSKKKLTDRRLYILHQVCFL